MPCYSPLRAFKARDGVFFDPSCGGVEIRLPCGKCIGCRLERSRQWAVRCLHEASLHDINQFITLTYNEEHLPYDKSLSVSSLQKFFRAARRAGNRFRYFACGEYGDRFNRPHYHALIFGKRFSDSELSKFWPFGFVHSGDVSFDSAGYVARYSLKKINGDLAHDHYKRIDFDTGEIFYLQPEFMLCSRRPGIGRYWVDNLLLDCYSGSRDSVIVNGVECKTPRYYDKVLQKTDNLLFDSKKVDRVRAINTFLRPGDLSPPKLKAARDVREARLHLSVRGFEK